MCDTYACVCLCACAVGGEQGCQRQKWAVLYQPVFILLSQLDSPGPENINTPDYQSGNKVRWKGGCGHCTNKLWALESTIFFLLHFLVREKSREHDFHSAPIQDRIIFLLPPKTARSGHLSSAWGCLLTKPTGDVWEIFLLILVWKRHIWQFSGLPPFSVRGSLLAGLRGPYEVPRIEPKSAAGKARAFPAVASAHVCCLVGGHM